MTWRLCFRMARTRLRASASKSCRPAGRDEGLKDAKSVRLRPSASSALSCSSRSSALSTARGRHIRPTSRTSAHHACLTGMASGEAISRRAHDRCSASAPSTPATSKTKSTYARSPASADCRPVTGVEISADPEGRARRKMLEPDVEVEVTMLSSRLKRWSRFSSNERGVTHAGGSSWPLSSRCTCTNVTISDVSRIRLALENTLLSHSSPCLHALQLSSWVTSWRGILAPLPRCCCVPLQTRLTSIFFWVAVVILKVSPFFRDSSTTSTLSSCTLWTPRQRRHLKWMKWPSTTASGKPFTDTVGLVSEQLELLERRRPFDLPN
mmetsp:Transcript_28082/g.70530  ORF Transcript_28082/g.70530 Transcript_28082/m.70530 type:complete len:324 (+) Transcript_28082:696-1667(+)